MIIKSSMIPPLSLRRTERVDRYGSRTSRSEGTNRCRNLSTCGPVNLLSTPTYDFPKPMLNHMANLEYQLEDWRKGRVHRINWLCFWSRGQNRILINLYIAQAFEILQTPPSSLHSSHADHTMQFCLMSALHCLHIVGIERS